jgi:hypothetical protein
MLPLKDRCVDCVSLTAFERQLKLVQDIVRSVSFFYVFAVFKGIYLKRHGPIDVKTNMLLGYLSAVFNLIGTMPFEVCNTRQVTGFSKGGVLSTAYDLVRYATPMSHAPTLAPRFDAQASQPPAGMLCLY